MDFSKIFNEPLLFLLIITYALALVGFYYSVVIKTQEKRAKRKQEFFNALKEGFKTSSLTTIDDIVDIYKGVSGSGTDDFDYRYGLSRQLREFLVELISKKMDESLGDETIRDWKVKLSEFIKKNEEMSPYADLPPTERNILNDMTTFIDKNDMESLKRKTSELSGIIQAKHDDLNKVRNLNKWTVPLSIIGLVLTVIFGILALMK